MDYRIQLASVAVGLAIWYLVGWSIKQAKLYPSYAVLWTLLGGLLIALPMYANQLRWMAGNIFGIVGANHLVYAILFSFMLIYMFYLTQKLCRLTNSVERLIVNLAILEVQSGHVMPAAATSGANKSDQHDR
jgi:hypothetical protein